MSETNAPIDDALAEIGELLEAEAEQARQDYDEAGMDWLPNWFLTKLADIDAADARIKGQTKVLLAQNEAKRRALWWKWGQPFEVQVNKDMQEQGGKKRSFDYIQGRAGYRKKAAKPGVVIDNPETAEANARLLLDDAVTVKIKTSALLDYFKKTGEELPGTHIEHSEEQNIFYATPAKEKDDD